MHTQRRLEDVSADVNTVLLMKMLVGKQKESTSLLSLWVYHLELLRPFAKELIRKGLWCCKVCSGGVDLMGKDKGQREKKAKMQQSRNVLTILKLL